ncbi:MAG: DnaJ domain-containing protein [Leptospiraceae bacterium]|nr:DnaJ domain-containing protein [Leptospiraceae bacterium]MCP5510413.1 DnaJ domain-containing protein [Leptospiraceae bacterium]
MLKIFFGIFLVFFFHNGLLYSESFFVFLLSIFGFGMGVKNILRGIEEIKLGSSGNAYARFSQKRPWYQGQVGPETQSYFTLKLRELQEGRDERDIIASYITVISMHVAKFDGLVSERELGFLKFSLNKFPGGVDHNFIAEIVSISKEYLLSINRDQYIPSMIRLIEDYLALFSGFNPIDNREVYFDLITMLYAMGLADSGRMSSEKESFFHYFFGYLGFNSAVKEYIRYSGHSEYSRFSGTSSGYNRTHSGQINSGNKIQEGIRFFGLSENFTKDELEIAWKKMAKTYHPDKYHNADEKVYKEMNQKFVEAKEYYQILQERFKYK